MPSPERGFMIAEAVSAMNFEYHLKKLTERRERRKRGRKRKEADKAATLTTSRGLSGDKTYIYYSGKGGVCQLPQSAKLTALSEKEPLFGGGVCQVYDTSSTASGPPSPQGEGLRGAVCRE